MSAIDVINIIAMIIGYILIAVLLLVYSLYRRVKRKQKLTEDDRRNRAWLLRYQGSIGYREFCEKAHHCYSCQNYHLPMDTCTPESFTDKIQ